MLEGAWGERAASFILSRGARQVTLHGHLEARYYHGSIFSAQQGGRLQRAGRSNTQNSFTMFIMLNLHVEQVRIARIPLRSA